MDWNFVLFSALKILGVFSVLMFIVAYAVWVERKVAAAIQDRRGPNRFGPFGLLQPAADAIKAFLKEDFTPAHVRKVYYWLAPAIVMIPAILVVAIIFLVTSSSSISWETTPFNSRTKRIPTTPPKCVCANSSLRFLNCHAS